MPEEPDDVMPEDPDETIQDVEDETAPPGFCFALPEREALDHIDSPMDFFLTEDLFLWAEAMGRIKRDYAQGTPIGPPSYMEITENIFVDRKPRSVDVRGMLLRSIYPYIKIHHVTR